MYFRIYNQLSVFNLIFLCILVIVENYYFFKLNFEEEVVLDWQILKIYFRFFEGFFLRGFYGGVYI